MSLQTLRDMRLARLRPAAVTLVLRDCPKPWPWLRDDPAVVWLPQRADVRSHDLRPLVGLPVTALVDDLDRRMSQVREAVAGVGGVLLGIADEDRALVTDQHPWAVIGEKFSDPNWRQLVAPAMVSDRNFYWSF